MLRHATLHHTKSCPARPAMPRRASSNPMALVHAGATHSSPSAGWIEMVLRDDQMVDAFARLYPAAQGRFTCWDQYRNQRYENVGTRIDYTLVDQAFFDAYVLPGGCGLYNPADGKGVPAHHCTHRARHACRGQAHTAARHSLRAQR